MGIFLTNHYRAIAEVILAAQDEKDFEILVTSLADMLENDNPAFSRQQFLKACEDTYHLGEAYP